LLNKDQVFFDLLILWNLSIFTHIHTPSLLQCKGKKDDIFVLCSMNFVLKYFPDVKLVCNILSFQGGRAEQDILFPAELK
jgi:hypothetical protein